LPAVQHLARLLAIPDKHVYAVPLHFDAAGAYLGFDATSPLSRADGKATVCRRLAARYRAVAMVGDGATDLAARDGGAYVVGFGGVAHRQAVARGADCYVRSADLTATLEPLLSEEERKSLGLA
jgi:phosphoserine phosphatase